MTKKIFLYHGTNSQLDLRNISNLQSIGFGNNSGMEYTMKLKYPRYVAVILLHRSFVSSTDFPHKDRFKFVPFYIPTNQLACIAPFVVKEGVLAGSKFGCNIRFMKTIDPEIVNGHLKCKSRFTIYNEARGS